MNAESNSMLRLLRSHGPTVAVLIGLSAIAYWGHVNDWRAPKFATLRSSGEMEATPADDWCAEHKVPESRCIACNPGLSGSHDLSDWCGEHGVPESKCLLCHPELATRVDASADWCAEHGLPESQCTICHPEIAVKGTLPAADATIRVTREGTATDSRSCQSHLLRVQFASEASLKKSGIALASVGEQPLSATVRGNGEVTYDPARVVHISARAAGTIARTEKSLGGRVAAGELLVLVDAAAVGEAKAELLGSLTHLAVTEKAFARIRSATEARLRTQAELDEAEAVAREARIRLISAEQALANLGLPVQAAALAGLSDDELARSIRLLGIPQSARASLAASATSANLLPLFAPFAGVVTTYHAVPGEVVEPGTPLFVIADTSRMHVRIDARLEDAALLAVGQMVHFVPDSQGDDAVTGAIVWISTEVDDTTKTLQLRADVDNADGRLRAGVFGSARIVVRNSANAVVVPRDAVHWEGCCHVVFVRLSNDLFQTRKVRVGVTTKHETEIIAGLVAGEVIATTGSRVLLAEILSSRLGAGCCGE